MNSPESTHALQSVFRKLQTATDELSRPQEDVVTLAACQTVRNSMHEMMQIYLQARGEAPAVNPGLEQLLEQCAAHNSEFSRVDFSNIECRGVGHEQCDGKYCLSVDRVSGCLSAAGKLKEIISTELQ